MVKHIVCWKLKDNSSENIRKTYDVLMSMKGKCPQLRSIFVGIDFLHSQRSCDIMLEVEVDDRAALDAYQADEYHCSVVKTYMKTVVESAVSMDCEM